MIMICKLCLFYKVSRGTDRLALGGGECRRQPPTIHVWTHDGSCGEEIRSTTEWPSVLETEWCGEFKKRET